MTETTVRFDPQHMLALRRALDALKAERRLLEKWHCHSTQLALEIDDLEELLDRMSAAVGARRVMEAVS